ncbi:unnamed protein product [Kluyveromyces dobzhanskii CBS 2104]|uniref:WGS project CCBQ000000000 data, contig 00102 n=1 Tax=Kluyveromyces dobzhanskii CBS 2104 TaxID=1427455 RepID=A0A0A8L793_9SACH|nr:unnamed protein product [Kluyveromyces dobzhanskii CBS 2104]
MSDAVETEIIDEQLVTALSSSPDSSATETQLQEAAEDDKNAKGGKGKEKKRKYVSEMRNAYKSWYMDEAYDFFVPLAHNKDLRKSRIHKDGICKYLQKDDAKLRSDEELGGMDDGASDSDLEYSDEERRSGGYLQNQGLGSLWTGKEKQVFFHHLARHSIHALDSWSSQIPGKSKYEILMYYRVLQRNLEELRRLPTRRHGGILDYEKLPIAYEMTESWITLEEELSQEVQEDVTTTHGDTSNDDADESSLTLIDWSNWYKRWDTFYAKHRLLEYYPSNRKPNMFTPESMQIMETLAKRYTSNLLRETIIPTLEKKSVPKELLTSQKLFKKSRKKKLRSACEIAKPLGGQQNEDDVIEIQTSNHEFPHIVTEKEVISALVRLRLYHKSKVYLTYPESIVDSVRKFQVDLERGKIFRNKNVLRHLIVLLYLQSSRIHSKQLSFPKEDKNEKIDWYSDTTSTDDENKGTKRKQMDPLFVDTPEYKRQKVQDESLDQMDQLRSTKYTHTLLTWLDLSRDRNPRQEHVSTPTLDRIHVTW